MCRSRDEAYELELEQHARSSSNQTQVRPSHNQVLPPLWITRHYLSKSPPITSHRHHRHSSASFLLHSSSHNSLSRMGPASIARHTHSPKTPAIGLPLFVPLDLREARSGSCNHPDAKIHCIIQFAANHLRPRSRVWSHDPGSFPAVEAFRYPSQIHYALTRHA